MANPTHSKQTVDDGIHIVHSVEVADAAGRTAYSAATVSEDVGRYVRQVDTGFFYIVQTAGAPDLVQVVPPPGGAPSGPASGQLSGSYPSPDVVGVTAAGPTALGFGAIGDGQLLSRSGSDIIGVNAPSAPLGAFYAYAEDWGQSSSTGVVYATKLTLVTPAVTAANYRIGWSFTYGASSTNQDFRSRIILDGNTASPVWESRTESKDPGADQQIPASAFRRVALGAGVHSIDIQYSGTDGGTTARIAQANLEFYQVP